MKNNNWLKNWVTIDLLDLVIEIGSECKNFQNHPVYKEWQYILENSSKGNGVGILTSVGDDENIPLINEFLLNEGFPKDERIIFWISW